MEAALQHDGPMVSSAHIRSGPLVSLVRAIDTFVLWQFGPRAPWVHLFFGGLDLGWAAIMVVNPSIFDSNRLGYGALAVLPDAVWIGGHLLIAALHGLGLVRPGWGNWRATACLASAWVWLFLAFSFALSNGATPGVMVNLWLGALAVLAGLYVAWRRPDPV